MGMYWLQYRNRLMVVILLVLAASGGYGFARVTDRHAEGGALPAANKEMAALLAGLEPKASAAVPKAQVSALPAATTDESKTGPAVAVASDTESMPPPATAAPAKVPAAAGDQNSQPSQPNQTAQDGKIDLNTANLQQLMDLPRIGESKANAIIAYREQHGGFKSASEIMNVKGIGEKTYESFRDQITASKP